MKGFFLFVAAFLWTACGQTTASGKHNDLRDLYVKAIGDFIQAAKVVPTVVIDTLYFGRQHNGTEGDFPEIDLPRTIAGKEIRLVEPEQSKAIMAERPNRVYVNLVGWEDAQTANFIFVVFSNGFAHQYDYKVEYRYDGPSKQYLISKEKIKNIF